MHIVSPNCPGTVVSAPSNRDARYGRSRIKYPLCAQAPEMKALCMCVTVTLLCQNLNIEKFSITDGCAIHNHISS